MAVEIPVVIDIDKAFKEAAKKVGVAMMPLEKQIEKLTSDLAAWREILNQSDIKGDDWLVAAKNIQAISEQIAVADYELRRYTSNEGSIRRMNTDLAEMTRRWEAMGSAQKFNQDGSLSKDAKKLVQDYKTVSDEIEKTGRTLQKIVAEEQRLNDLKQKGIQTRKYEKAVLNSSVKTIRILQEQERILSARLSQSQIGGSKYNALKQQLQAVRAEMEKLNKEASPAKIDATTNAIKRQSGAWMQVKSLATMYLSVLGGLRFVQNIRNVTAELEMQKVALGGIIQDTEKAETLFTRIKAAALRSPFEIKDLVTYTKQLSAYRIETDKLFDVTMRLADVSAGLGVSMDRLILAYGQVRAASVLRGQELRQFTEAGIPLVDLLAKKFTELNGTMTSTAQVFELISKRAVPFSMIEDIFNDMTNAGGIFYNMQEKQSETLKGQWMKLKDAVTLMYDEIGNTEAVNSFMKFWISTLNSLARNWRTIADIMKISIAGMISYAVVTKQAAIATGAKVAIDQKDLALSRARFLSSLNLTRALLGKNLTLKVGVWWTRKYVAAETAAAAATGVFSSALAKLKLALLSNPFTAAIVALTALATGIFAITKAVGGARISMEEFEREVESVSHGLEKLRDASNLVKVYDELSKKQNKNAAETEKLKRVTMELGKLYPGVIQGVDTFTEHLELSTEKLSNMLADEKQILLGLAESDIDKAKNQVKRLEAEFERIGRELERGTTYEYGAGQDAAMREVALTDKDRESRLRRQLEILKEWRQWQTKIKESQDLLSEQEYTVKTPYFLGDAMRTNLYNYQTVLASTETKTRAFTQKQIEDFSSIKDALDEAAKQYKDYKEKASVAEKAAEKASGKLKEQYEGQKNDAIALRDLYAQILTDYDAWDLVKGKTGKDKTLQNQIQEITNAYKKFIELRKREGTKAALADVDTLFPDLAGWEPTYDNVIQRLERMLTLYKGNADMTKLIKQALVNVKFDELKRVMDDTLKRLADDIKRSETARNFYNDILGLTGDRDLAASMSIEIYGETGEQIKEKIQEQLRQAFVIDDAMVNADGLQLQSVKDAIESAIKSGNAKELRKFLKYVVEDERKGAAEILQNWEKAAQERMKTWVTELAKAKSYADKRVEIATKTAQRLREIDELAPQSQKEKLREQALEKQAKDMAKLEYEAFRDTPLYTEMFENLDAVSTQTLQRMRDELVRLQGVWKDLDPTQLKEIQSRLDAIDKVAATRNPFGTLAKGFKELIKAGFGKSSQLDKDAADAAERVTRARVAQAAALEAYTKAQDEYNKIVAKSGSTSPEAKAAEQRLNAARMTLDAQTRNLKVAEELAKKAEQEKADYADILRSISNGVAGLLEFNEHVQDAGEGALSIMEAFGSSVESIEMISTMLGGLNDTISGISSTAAGFSQLLSGNIISGASNIAKGIGGLFKGITNIFYAGRVKRANKEIKKQEKILISLQEAYKDLDRAIAKAFGNEYIYNYNQQLKNLQAQAAAYQKQAAAERSKGKKKDKSKIESYEQSYRDTLNEIKDMQYQMAEYFAGTDITSAAEAFADAWLEAYKEFGNTTDAIKEKMQDMVESIVKRAALAGVVQAVLQPWYNELAQIEQWDPGMIATMIQKAYDLVPTITAGLGSEAAALQAAGVNLRDTVGDFKGISRDIAGASEESILALAAGINTQNFYMSYMPIINENVAAIRAALTGEAVGAQAPSLVQSNNDLVLQYMSVLPNMDANIAELLAIARKVVEPRGTNSSSHVVAVRM